MLPGSYHVLVRASVFGSGVLVLACLFDIMGQVR